MAEAQLAKKVKGWQVIRLSVRQQHPDAALQHKGPEMFEKLNRDTLSMRFRFDAQPDKMAILPGRVALFYRRTQKEAYNLLIRVGTW